MLAMELTEMSQPPQDRRVIRRFDMRLPATVKMTGEVPDQMLTETMNVSAKGIFFYLDRKIERRLPVRGHPDLPTPRDPDRFSKGSVHGESCESGKPVTGFTGRRSRSHRRLRVPKSNKRTGPNRVDALNLLYLFRLCGGGRLAASLIFYSDHLHPSATANTVVAKFPDRQCGSPRSPCRPNKESSSRPPRLRQLTHGVRLIDFPPENFIPIPRPVHQPAKT